MDKKERAVWFLAALLVLLFVLSLLPNAKKGSLKAENTVILNPHEKERLTELSLTCGNEAVRFFKTEDMWAAEAGASVFPCNHERLSAFIEQLTKTRKQYRFSGRAAPVSDYTNGGKDLCTLSWILEGCGKTYSLYIGKSDFSKTVRFVSTDGKNIKKLAVDFDNYLNASARFWCDPYIIPHSLFKKSAAADGIRSIAGETAGKKTILRAGTRDFDEAAGRLVSLRHGGLTDLSLPPDGAPAFRIAVRFTDGAICTFSLSAYGSSDYLITYDLPAPFRYAAIVSSWTVAEGIDFIR